MRKKEFDWGEFYDDNGEWLAERPVKRHLRLVWWKKLLLQAGAAALLFGCFYGLRATETLIGNMAGRAADYSVSHQIGFEELQAVAEPYLSRFAEVEIFQGVQEVTAKVMRPVPLVERPAEWQTGSFDGTQRSYALLHGEAVKSIGSGRVVAVEDSSVGRTLAVQYGHTLEARFSGLDEVYVRQGDRVRMGQTLGISALSEDGHSGVFKLLLLENGRAVDAESLFDTE